MSLPSEGVRAPSAMVSGLLTVCSTRVWNDRVGVVPRRRLHADHAAGRGEGARRDGAAREQPAAAAGHEQQVERSRLLEQLDRRRALPGDDVGVVEGRDQDRARAPRPAACAISSRVVAAARS